MDIDRRVNIGVRLMAARRATKPIRRPRRFIHVATRSATLRGVRRGDPRHLPTHGVHLVPKIYLDHAPTPIQDRTVESSFLCNLGPRFGGRSGRRTRHLLNL